MTVFGQSKPRKAVWLLGIITISLLTLATAQGEEPDPYAGYSPEKAAALCVSLIDNCPELLASKTEDCKANRFFFGQSEKCRVTACKYCKDNWNKGHNFCIRSWTILFRCALTIPWITANPSPSMSISPTSTPSISISSTPSMSGSTTPTPTPSVTSTPSPTATSTISVSVSSIPSMSVSSSPTPSASDNSTVIISVDDDSDDIIGTTLMPTGMFDDDTVMSVPSMEDMMTSTGNITARQLPDARAAAECVSSQTNCNNSTADRSKVCFAGRYVKKQPTACIDIACQYCRTAFGRLENICRESWAINTYCNASTASQTPSTSASPSPNSSKSFNLSANAMCVSKGTNCGKQEAENSNGCKEGMYVKLQSNECIQGACTYCSQAENKNTMLCSTNWAIQIYCFGSPRPSASPSSTPSASPNTVPSASLSARPSPTMNTKPTNNCTWIGTEQHLVIPMNQVKTPYSYWSSYEDPDDEDTKTDGIEWRQGDENTGVDSPGLGGICFTGKFVKQGTYYLTAYTKAPHWSEHNDMWVNFTGGLQLYRAGTHVKLNNQNLSPYKSYKAYQNMGKNQLNDIISSVNFNPHLFVTQSIKKDTTYQVCISGRSSQFKVYKLVFVYCEGDNCKRSSEYIRGIMTDIKTNNYISRSEC